MFFSIQFNSNLAQSSISIALAKKYRNGRLGWNGFMQSSYALFSEYHLSQTTQWTLIGRATKSCKQIVSSLIYLILENKVVFKDQPIKTKEGFLPNNCCNISKTFRENTQVDVFFLKSSPIKGVSWEYFESFQRVWLQSR